MAKNRSMAIKHKKARLWACKLYKDQALRESMEDVKDGKLTFCTDSIESRKHRHKKVERKLVAKVSYGHTSKYGKGLIYV